MKKIYTHEGFEIVIELEGVARRLIPAVPLRPEGYLAIMHISMAGLPRPIVGPIRLSADISRPFPTQAEALMSAFSAGQRFVEDKFVRR